MKSIKKTKIPPLLLFQILALYIFEASTKFV